VSRGAGISQAYLRAFTALLLAAAVLRALHLVEQARDLPFLFHPVMDAALYRDWAMDLARGLPAATGAYYHAPGYPLLLSLIVRAFGSGPLPAVVFQSLAGVTTVALVVFLGLRLFGPGTGLLAGGLLLAVGPLYFFEAKLLATSWAVFGATAAVALAVVAGLRVDAGPRTGRWAPFVLLAGLAAGVLSVLRANLILLPTLLVLEFIRRAATGRVSWRLPVLYAVAVAVPVVPSFVNNLAHGVAAPVATNGGFNFYAGNARGATGVYVDVPGVSGVIRRQEAETDSLAALALGHEPAPGEAARYWWRRGMDEIGADPAAWLGLVARKARLLVTRQDETVNGSYAVESERVPVLRLAALPWNLLVALGLVGLWLAVRGRRFRARAPTWPAAALLIAVAVSGLGFFVMTRLRLPAAPVLAVFAAHALVTARAAWGEGFRLRVLATGIGVVVFIALTWTSPLGAARNPQWESQLFLEAGRRLEAEGDRPAAARAFAEAAARDPASVDALVARAGLAMARQDRAGAIRALEAAVLVAPDRFDLRNNLGILYYAAGRPDDCLREMDAAHQARPRAGSPYLYQGHVYRDRGDPRAVEAYEAALERDPTLRGAYLGLVAVLRAEGRGAEAAAWVARAREHGVAVAPDSLAAGGR